MSKFNTPGVRAATTSPVTTEPASSGPTHQGGPGFSRDAKSELFTLAVTNMVSEKTFYEQALDRDSRYRALVAAVAVEDPEWLLHLTGWLRTGAGLRSVALVTALETVAAVLASAPATHETGGPRTRVMPDGRGVLRAIVDVALDRADEPGEALAYWIERHGRAVPMPVKRGIGDAVRRLYTQRGLLKYDTPSHGFRFGDVIELVHPYPSSDWQDRLFRFALDRRRGRQDVPEGLHVVEANRQLRLRAAEDPAALLDTNLLHAAAMTWEDVLSLAGDRVPKRDLWSALVPVMGYTALLRNLRNLDEAGVPDDVAERAVARLRDPEQVLRSREMPLRFLAAHREAPSLRWGHALEVALQHSLGSVPALDGRTLVLVDTSSSMHDPLSERSSLLRWDAAVAFGLALAARAKHADVYTFSSTARHYGDRHAGNARRFPAVGAESLLGAIARWKRDGFFLGGGTATAAAVRMTYSGHARVVILTDEQAGVDSLDVGACVPERVPLYTWNLAGYARGHAPAGTTYRHTFGGLTDRMFGLIPLLESGRSGVWPWEMSPLAAAMTVATTATTEATA